MKAFVLLLCMPAMTICNMEIKIDAVHDKDAWKIKIQHRGNSTPIISDVNIKNFELTEEIIKYAINGYFGKRPNDVYLKKPTPYGGFHAQFNEKWNQVHTIFKPFGAYIVSVTSKRVIVMKQVFENTLKKTKAKFNAGISRAINNTVTSKWYRKHDIKTDSEVNYYINLFFNSEGTKADFHYKTEWGKNYEVIKSETIGATSAIELELGPGQSVEATLYATKTYVTFKVQYITTLSGHIIANYAQTYKGHHFWKLDVNQVIDSAALMRKIVSLEKISLCYYWKSKVTVQDRHSKKIISDMHF